MQKERHNYRLNLPLSVFKSLFFFFFFFFCFVFFCFAFFLFFFFFFFFSSSSSSSLFFRRDIFTDKKIKKIWSKMILYQF